VHTLEDVEETIAAFDAVSKKLISGKYRVEGLQEIMD